MQFSIQNIEPSWPVLRAVDKVSFRPGDAVIHKAYTSS